MTNKILGKQGEEIAQNFLTKNGFEILETNFHYSKNSEIDIIAKKNNAIHFIEVKTRKNNSTSPLEAITKEKLMRIKNCAMYYLRTIEKEFEKMQIDAIAVVFENKKPKITFVENIYLD